MGAKVTITAGWSGDSLYCLEDVNKLFRGVKRNTTIPFDFILHAGPEAQKPGKLDGLEDGIRVIESPYPSWWVGMKSADPDNRPWIKTDSILGLGLDCVITGSLDDLINYPSNLASMRDWPSHFPIDAARRNDCNLEVTLVRGDADRKIWEEYVRVGKPQWDHACPPENRVWSMCAQGWINDTKAVHVDLFPETWVCSYKYQVLRKGLPADARIVSFHGKPKPKDVPDQFVKDNWI